MATDDGGAGEFRGASFTSEDFTGATFRDCDLRQVKITDSWLVDVHLSGLVGNLVVNDVDVSAYVEGELDKRHPERVQLRAMRTANDYRAMWDTIEDLWSQTVARAGRLRGHRPGVGHGEAGADLASFCARVRRWGRSIGLSASAAAGSGLRS